MSGSTMKEPGALLGWLMRRRLTASQREILMAELAELYEHRVRRDGSDGADAWVGREYRRWTFRLLIGGVAPTVDPVDAFSGEPARAGSSLGQDLRHSVRGLVRAPLFSLSLAITVGLGIGGTALVYTVVHSVLIAPLPYDAADDLVLFRTIRGTSAWGTSMADLDAVYHEPPSAFADIAAYNRSTSAVAVGREVELLSVKRVTANYFPMLGIDPVQGRHFEPDESLAGAADVVMITESFWGRAFDRDPNAIGSSLSIDGAPHTVTAILPDELGPLDLVDVYPALRVATPGRKGPFFFPIVGKLRPGVEPAIARQQLDEVAARIFPIWQSSFPNDDATIGFVELKDVLVGNVERTLLMVLTAVTLLLLIASANAASLLVARGTTRVREVSIRSAMGASRGRLTRLLMTEAALLAVAGAALGWAITVAGTDMVRRLGVGALPRAEEIAISAPTVAFFLAVTAASWALFGLIATGTVLARRDDGLATTWSRATASPRMRAVRRGLVAAQFAITVPLLVGAGLLGRSLGQLQDEDLGFDATNVISMQVSLPPATYPDEQSVIDFWERALPEVRATAGVAMAGIADARPPVISNGQNNLVLEGRPLADGEVIQVPWIMAGAGYLDVLGIPFLEGRGYHQRGSDTMRVAVVDQAWQQRFFPGESAVGRRFRSGGCTVDGCPFTEVIGVVSNVKTVGLQDDFSLGTIYYDYRQEAYPTTNLHLRSNADPYAAASAARAVIASIDPSVAVADIRTVDELAGQSVQGRRYTSLLVALLATVALMLSIVGIYGAMAYYVRQQQREIGVRIALGGTPGSALALVVRQGLQVALLGTVVGTVGALSLTRFMQGLLYEVSATDPLIFGAVFTGSVLLAVVASAVPGRAAAATDAAITLRED